VIRRVLLLDHPQETRFFAFLGVFGLVLAAIYWFLTYEVAGTILLFGFGAGAGLLAIGLYRSRPGAVAVGVARGVADPPTVASQVAGGDAGDVPGGGTGGVDTPFETPLGRLPGETLAPLSLGLGVALSITAVVFGPWLLVAGLVPIAWGAWTWYTAARDELRATVTHEPPVAGSLADPAGDRSRAAPRDVADSTGDLA
jgi:hypothetical protein